MKWNRIILVSILFSFYSCVSDKEEGVLISDATLFNLISSSSYAFYKNKPDTLATDPASPHGSFIRLRLNPKAQSAMNDSLSRLSASSFPNESLLIKEVYNTRGGALESYEVMYKIKGASNSNSGWVWNEMGPDGNVLYSAARKGDACYSCHSEGTNADLVRTFALH